MVHVLSRAAMRCALLSLSLVSLLLLAGAADVPVRSSKVYMGVQIRNRQGGGIDVVAVDPEGPAGKAGLKAGDVITAFGGTLFLGKGDDVTQLFMLLPKLGTAKPVQLQFQRGARKGKLYVQLAEKPFMGVAVAEHEGQGLLVQQVLEGTIAQQAGILAGDVIIGFGKEVWMATDVKPPAFISAVMSAPFDKAIKMTLMRGGKLLHKVVIFRKGNPYVFKPVKRPSRAQTRAQNIARKRRAAGQGRRPGVPAMPRQTGPPPVMGGTVTPTTPATPAPQSQPAPPDDSGVEE